VEAVYLQKKRILSLHLKDPVSTNPEAHDTIFGRGAGKVPEVLQALRRVGFNGYISIEYEHNWTNSVPDVAQCIQFIRDWEKNAAKK
jgi:sugar phosphate isomerase/epimerase